MHKTRACRALGKTLIHEKVRERVKVKEGKRWNKRTKGNKCLSTIKYKFSKLGGLVHRPEDSDNLQTDAEDSEEEKE